jgi:hypothetical protein
MMVSRAQINPLHFYYSLHACCALTFYTLFCFFENPFIENAYQIILPIDAKDEDGLENLEESSMASVDKEQLQEKEMVLIEADTVTLKVVEAAKKTSPKKGGTNTAGMNQQERVSHHRKASMMNVNANRKTLLQKQKASSRKGSMMPISGKGILEDGGGDHTSFNDLRSHIHKHTPVPLTFKGVIKIVAVEKALAMDRDLIITVQEEDGESLTAKNEVSIKLPMLCAVDGELATSYAKSLVSRLRVEMTDGGDKEPKIIVADAEKDEQVDAGFGEYFDNINRSKEA